MKTKEDKINIVTLGCAKNIVDSQILLTQLRGNDFDAYHENNDNDSNIIIINTCGFIENAKQESIDTILKFAQEKKRGNIKRLYVTGCLSERYKENLEKEIPEVDEYFGTNDLSKLLRNLKAKYRKDLI